MSSDSDTVVDEQLPASTATGPPRPSLTVGEKAADDVRLADTKLRNDLWAKQEDIAMHFNDLTMRLRLQALAGIGAALLASGSIFTHEGEINLKPIGCFMMALASIWFGIGLLDIFYYQALLKGAVVSLKELEVTMPAKLSTAIESNTKWYGRWSRYFFYAIVFVLLAYGGYWMQKEGHAQLISPKAKPLVTPDAGADTGR